MFQRPAQLRGAGLVFTFFAWMQVPALHGQTPVPASIPSAQSDFTLEAYMQRVMEHNESLQARLLAFHASRNQRKAENGLFEPSFVASGELVDRQRPNTIEVERSLRSGGIFTERNNNYSSGLEMLTPLGTRLKFGATGRRLVNNIQRTVVIDLDAEFESQIGLTVEQPLLKGAGHAATLASLRLAARGSEIAYQEYRRHLMQVVAEAELAYWQLYSAQQELRLSMESTAVARTLVNDTRAGFEAGRGSQLDVLEAEAGLAVRNSRESMSRQKRFEAMNRFAAYFGGSARAAQTQFAAAESPRSRPIELLVEEGIRTALAMSPDLLRLQAQVDQEKVRLGYSKNQRLPQLDLKASYGTQGLGYDWRSSFNDVQNRDFPTWSVALEARIPLWGGVRSGYELRASRNRLLQAERLASDMTTTLRSGVDTAQQRVTESYNAARSFQTVIDFRGNLLETRLKSREVGRIDSRAVLEAEQELFAARHDLLQSEIEHQRALLELQIVSGTLLQIRGIDVSFADIERTTSAWANKATGPLPGLTYRAPVFDRWPVGPPIPFQGEGELVYPMRLRLKRPSAK